MPPKAVVALAGWLFAALLLSTCPRDAMSLASTSDTRPTPKEPARVLVVGAGSISREYALHHFTPDATGTVVVGIVDMDETRASHLASDVASAIAGGKVTNVDGNKYRASVTQGTKGEGGAVPHFTSLEEALDRIDDAYGGVDLVYIGTTPKSHRVLAELALRRGKRVLLEKPIAASKEDADAIVAASDAAAAILGRTRSMPSVALGMNIGMRYNAALQELRRRVLVNDELGIAARATAQRGNGDEAAPSLRAILKTHFVQWPREWQMQPWCAGREEGGPLKEVGTHFFSALLEFAGAHDEAPPAAAGATPVARVTGRVRATVEYPYTGAISGGFTPCETAASGVIELNGGALPPGGLSVELSVRTDADRDLYELMVMAVVNSEESCKEDIREQEKSLTLFDFCSLRNGRGEVLVRNASYGRQECVRALLAASGADDVEAPTVVTARHGRNAQRLLDAILESNGVWRNVDFD